MVTLHSNFTFLSMFLLYFFCSVSSFPVEIDPIQQILLGSYNTMDAGSTGKINKDSMRSPNIRVKRSKTFKDAGETSQLKVLKQLVQMIRNYWVKKPLGGKHPFDPTVPVIFSRIVKSKIFKLID